MLGDGATGLPAVFASGGEVGHDLGDVAWGRTPLGPCSTWPQSLVSVVQIMLSSRFAMWMGWGDDLTFFCNDAYRRDTLGNKYPWALGRPASEVWAEVWPDISARIEQVMLTGEATWDEGLMLFLERSGYREETYHTFSYSPLTDDGGIVGMLCVVSEDTQRVVGSRRMGAVRDLGAAVTALRSEAEVLDAANEQLQAADTCLPFTATYLFEPETTSLVLARSTGLSPGDPAAPMVMDIGRTDQAWPVETVMTARTHVVDDLSARFGPLPTGPWPEPPHHALLVPFRQQDDLAPLGFLVAGLNRYRPLDEDFQGFVELLAGQIGGALASARAYEAERERAERLQELDRAKTTFFTNVSHEFRTPLTLLLGPAEDALADTLHPLQATQRDRLEIVARNGERLLRLVNTLLDFSRLEAGTLDAQFEAVDLAAYTAELANAFSTAVDRVGLRLEVHCPPLASPVFVDREMWAKIVLNLLSNALKFTFEGGIEVRLSEHDGLARLDVADTGVGIAPADQGRLFERFSRVAGVESRSHEGSGIGLALVADLTAAHGGTVSVTSEPGSGTTFCIHIPLGSDHLPADRVVGVGAAAPSPPGAARSARGFLAEALRWLGAGRSDQHAADGADVPEVAVDEAAGAHGSRPRVLVVDDNADMRDYVWRLLAADHEVITAADGQEGLDAARRLGPDLVLSDVMMPRLDGFGLLAALRADPLTAQIPVVLLSARAGEEATVEGLDAGADDYLAKPFSGRELLARVRANLELERVRRTRRDLERSQLLLDQAQRLAQVGSWELDLDSGALSVSQELARQLQVDPDQIAQFGLAGVVAERVHPDDRDRVLALLAGATEGRPLDYEFRLVTPDGQVRTYRTRGEVEVDPEGRPARVRGSNQDVTAQHEAQRAVAAAATSAEAATREHRIADELQRSLLPATDVAAEGLQIAAFYRAGVEGTQVGGDWYDVIELGAGRTGLVLGDVMGRGVRAAAVMGQLRSAVRAYASLDLPPSEVLEHLDAIVRDLGDDQIVTCIYAVFDPHDGALTYASAGHLPPLVRRAGGEVRRLSDAGGPPLGAASGAVLEQELHLEPGDVLALYTDGLVERRDDDIDAGVDALAQALTGLSGPLAPDAPGRLVSRLLPDGPDDDVALLLAQVESRAPAAVQTLAVPEEPAAVAQVRRATATTLRGWGIGESTSEDVLLVVSELVTNAVVHGRPPLDARLRRTTRALTVEVQDASRYLPRRLSPDTQDEHGRGLQLVSMLATRWGTRPTPDGKAVWCTFDL